MIMKWYLFCICIYTDQSIIVARGELDFLIPKDKSSIRTLHVQGDDTIIKMSLSSWQICHLYIPFSAEIGPSAEGGWTKLCWTGVIWRSPHYEKERLGAEFLNLLLKISPFPTSVAQCTCFAIRLWALLRSDSDGLACCGRPAQF